MPDGNGVTNAAYKTNATTPYLNMNVVASDIPPTNAKTPLEFNGVWNKVYDAATNSIRVTSV